MFKIEGLVNTMVVFGPSVIITGVVSRGGLVVVTPVVAGVTFDVDEETVVVSDVVKTNVVVGTPVVVTTQRYSSLSTLPSLPH